MKIYYYKGSLIIPNNINKLIVFITGNYLYNHFNIFIRDITICISRIYKFRKLNSGNYPYNLRTLTCNYNYNSKIPYKCIKKYIMI